MVGDVVNQLDVPKDVACERLAGGEFFFAFRGKVSRSEVGDGDTVRKEGINACSASDGESWGGLFDAAGGFLCPC